MSIALWHRKKTMRNQYRMGEKGDAKMAKSTARTASKILRDGRYSDAAKSVAGSALSQRADACRKRK